MVNRTEWTIHKATGHLAHASGLYAYSSKTPTETGALLCAGPFSSFKKRISGADARTCTLGAIALVEDMLPGSYTVWGTYSRTSCNSAHKIDLLGEEFDFLANPCFRSSTLLSSAANTADLQESIAKEWTWSNDHREITHQMGLRFRFSRTSPNQLDCDLSLTRRTQDLSLLHDEIKPALMKSLCMTAASVLSTLSVDGFYSETRGNKLSITIADDLRSA